MAEHERQAVADKAHRHIGGQAQGEVRQHPADVVAAPGGIRRAAAPIGQRACAHHDARVAGQWADLPDDAHRPIEAAVVAPARGEVDHLDFAALAVAQYRAQHRGIGQVVLFAALEILEFHREVATFALGREQRAKRRVTVERRQAAPHHACLAVHQCTKTAIADDAQIQRRLGHEMRNVLGEKRWGARNALTRYARCAATRHARRRCLTRGNVRRSARGRRPARSSRRGDWPPGNRIRR